MRNLKIFSVLLMSLVLTGIFVGMAAAQATTPATTSSGGFSGGITKFIDGLQESGKPIFNALLGKTDDGGELFTKILAFLLVMFIVYGVLSTVGILGSKNWINLIIGGIVAILGIRFLPPGFIEGMAVPSSAFVAVLVLGIPFILLHFLIKDLPSSGRRAVWVAFGVLILILWIYNIGSTDIPPAAKWVYPIILIATAAAFWFDGTIQKIWGKAESQRTVEGTTNVARHRVISDIEKLQNSLAAVTTQKDRNKVIKEIENKKKALDAL